MPMVILTVLIIGIVIGIGVIIFDQFGDAVQVDTIVTDENVALASGAGTTANDEVISLEGLSNSTNVLIYRNESLTSQINFTSTGIAYDTTLTELAEASTQVANYTYEEDTAGTTAVWGMRDSVDDFVTWLPVIIIILATAIILGLVMRSFRS